MTKIVHLSGASCWLAACLVLTAWCQGDPGPADRPASAVLEGAWVGSWGGGERDGVVFQPVLADCVIQGQSIEYQGLRRLGTGRGTVVVNTDRKQILVTDVAADSRAHEFRYALRGDTLTLTDEDGVEITLGRVPTETDPLADLAVELVAAQGFAADGSLQVVNYTRLRTESQSPSLSRARRRSVSMEGAQVLLVDTLAVRKLTLDEARVRLIEPTVVVIATRPRLTAGAGGDATGREQGPWSADSPAAARTLQRLFRPGTLVFVVPEQVVVP